MTKDTLITEEISPVAYRLLSVKGYIQSPAKSLQIKSDAVKPAVYLLLKLGEAVYFWCYWAKSP